MSRSKKLTDNKVKVGISFEEALALTFEYSLPTRFFSGVTGHMKDNNYTLITQEQALQLSKLENVVVIWSAPRGRRGCEIVIQDK